MNYGLSVVIPNYNGSGLFPQTLPTVYTALKNMHLPFEVVVADDVSTDDSISYLKQHFPFVKIVSNNVNSGFSVSANNGIRQAAYDLVLLLNSDVKLEEGYFTYLLQYFNRKDTFGVMGRIIGWEDENIQDGAKLPSFHFAKIKTSLNYLLKNESDMEKGLLTVYLSGANALLDRNKFLELGGFNEMFSPFYVEDYELSLRAWRMGYQCYFENRAVCRHRISTSIQKGNKKTFIKTISNRNKWFLHAIHLSPKRRWMWMMQLLPEILVQTLLLKEYYIKAFLLFLSSRDKIKKSRADLLLKSGNQLLEVEEVVKKIKDSIKDKQVIFFK